MTYSQPRPQFGDPELYRSLLDAAGVGIGIVDVRNGRIVHSNRELCELLGYSESELAGMSLPALTHPEDQSSIHTEVDRLIRGDSPRMGFQKRYMRKDGTTIWTLLTTTVLLGGSDRPSHTIAIIRDITAEKMAKLRLARMVRELHRQTRELAQVNSGLQEFTAMVSHDLKAPLRAISARAGMVCMELGDEASPQVKEHLAALQNRVRSMEAMINGLLNYSRAGRQCSRREINVRALLLKQLEAMDIPEGFTLEIADELPTVNADLFQLRQIFCNLIDNAIRHHDNMRGHVSITGRTCGNHHEFHVVDDGPGIPEEERERIFEMFESGRHHGAGSTGIGLAVVKRMVQENGGTIALTGGARGSTFTFTWPID
jgi:PAS domain S-box-containing protein